MPSIHITFKDCPTLNLKLDDSITAHSYYNLVKSTYEQKFPIFRDIAKYNVHYLKKLVTEAKKILGWEWDSDVYSTEVAVRLHKDIEQLLASGFDKISQEQDELLHELHFCLHLVQDNRYQGVRDGWLQIEWYNDNGFPLPEDFVFNKSMRFGDIKLQNPFVGHSPLQIYLENDHENIMQTCKLHNFVRPGINIVISPFADRYTNRDVIDFIKEKCPEFINMHGEEKINRFIGYPTIGRITNLNDLDLILKNEILELDYIIFHD